MIEDFKRKLLDYVENNNIGSPTMVTYTTTMSSRLKAKFMLRKYFLAYVNMMRSKLPFRHSYTLPVCWAIEESENSVHVHALYGTWIALRSHQKGWNTLHSQDIGRAYATTGGSWSEYIKYIFKSFDGQTRFIGHYADFKSPYLSTPKP